MKVRCNLKETHHFTDEPYQAAPVTWYRLLLLGFTYQCIDSQTDLHYIPIQLKDVFVIPISNYTSLLLVSDANHDF